MGLVVDYPKCGGLGTSNVSDTAQRAFQMKVHLPKLQ